VQSPGAELLSGTWDWQQLAIELDIPEDSEIVWAHLQTIAPARGTVWLDDASFEVIGPARSATKTAAAKNQALDGRHTPASEQRDVVGKHVVACALRTPSLDTPRARAQT
jgi:hypothetical protein